MLLNLNLKKTPKRYEQFYWQMLCLLGVFIMTKRMLIDATHSEETRVVVVNGNKLEDVEFETCSRKQIKGNIYLGKVMRIEPSLQACFVDYGGNKHGFLAFGEIHPDYYHISDEEIAIVDKEVDESIEAKKQYIKEREAERERIRAERALARAEAERRRAEEEAATKINDDNTDISENNESTEAETTLKKIEKDIEADELSPTVEENTSSTEESAEEQLSDEEIEEAAEAAHTKKRILKKKIRKQKSQSKAEKLSVMSEAIGLEEETIDEETAIPVETDNIVHDDDFETTDDDEDDEQDYDFELQRKLLKARKLYHRSRIQDVIKEGQIILVQIVKEERGNKGAALTTYLSLAGRYCVLMPNRIKSGGVSRKITNATDRKRLKSIVRELPLTADMSIIVRTAGEEKTKSDIVRDYNYLIRSWNQIRLGALAAKSPALIYEEGNLIKRALRDIYTKDISEILVDGEIAFKTARDFFKILSPHNLKKIKHYRNNDIPLFQRFQVETQLDKLHEATAQLDSGGYLVINPTEALVAIDVNSGRATKEKDLEETALKTNLEACDEVARQLRMRNLAGLVVIDFIDMEEPANNHAVERRMKEALKKDRSRVQVGKMSCFGLLEISRQRMHSSFLESNYIVCPHCHGQGVVRTVESGAVLVLRGIEEEGIKNRSSQINVFVPTDVAIYLLNQKRATLVELEQKYNMNVIISADDSIKNISDYQIERIKMPKISSQDKKSVDEIIIPENEAIAIQECENIEISVNKEAETEEENNFRKGRREKTRNRHDKGHRDRTAREKRDYNKNETKEAPNSDEKINPKTEAIILYNSHGNTTSNADENKSEQKPVKEKSTWWKKLIKG